MISSRLGVDNGWEDVNNTHAEKGLLGPQRGEMKVFGQLIWGPFHFPWKGSASAGWGRRLILERRETGAELGAQEAGPTGASWLGLRLKGAEEKSLHFPFGSPRPAHQSWKGDRLSIWYCRLRTGLVGSLGRVPPGAALGRWWVAVAAMDASDGCARERDRRDRWGVYDKLWAPESETRHKQTFFHLPRIMPLKTALYRRGRAPDYTSRDTGSCVCFALALTILVLF
nr:uncharacterized protein LOC105882891 [Microcebus murinus]